MQDEDHIAVNPEGLEPGVEVALVIREAIAAVRRRPRIAHAGKVRGEAAAERQEMGNDVPPEIGRRWIAVQKYYRIASASLGISNLRVQQWHVFPVGYVLGGDRAHGKLLALNTSKTYLIVFIGSTGKRCMLVFMKPSEKYAVPPGLALLYDFAN